MLAIPVALMALPRPAAAARERSDVAGALYFPSQEGLHSVAAPLLESEIEIHVSGLLARTRVRQLFHNPGDDWLEAIYAFPLPEMAAVDALEMRVGSRRIEGRIEERAEARRRYAAARQAGAKASLLEQDRPNLFTTAVANIGPGEQVEIAIEYQQTLRWDAGEVELRLPLVVAPRYLPGGVAPASDPPFPPPDLPLEATRIAERAVSGRGAVAIRIWLDAGVPLEWVASATHAIGVEELAEGRRYIESRSPADRDFVLRWAPRPAELPRVALFSEDDGRESTVLLLLLPPAAGAAEAEVEPAARGGFEREIVFVVDTSGSMAGASIAQARRALAVALGGLRAGDRFNLIAFDSTTRRLFPASRPADPRSVERALAWVRGLRAGGGTEMLPAIMAALAADDGTGDLRQVVFMTDGSIGNEVQLFERIRADLGRSRLFTVGIGAAPNAYFLRRAAKFGRGSFTFIARPDEVEERMHGLFRVLESPVLRDIEVHWNDPVEMWPPAPPDLYAGEPLVIAARVPRFVGELRISGRLGHEPWEMRLPLEPGLPEVGLHKLWARRKIASAMDSLGLGADRDAVRRTVLDVALEHGLVSRYTSLVAVETTPSRPASEALRAAAVPLDAPHGWDPSVAPGRLPRTATPASLLRMLGAAALLAALGIGRRRPSFRASGG